jgi:CheY-like chemotaxis protein
VRVAIHATEKECLALGRGRWSCRELLMESVARRILLVEDSVDDVILMRRAFRKLGIQNPLDVAEDGEAAIALLERLVDQADPDAAAKPGLILLDLKLPRVSGLEVLEWVRRQPAFRRCPVVVLTSSREAPDVSRAYDLGANSYLLKPVEFQAFVDLVRTLNLYWLVLNLPADSPTPRRQA